MLHFPASTAHVGTREAQLLWPRLVVACTGLGRDPRACVAAGVGVSMLQHFGAAAQTDPLDTANLLLRGSTLRKTEWVIGVVVFTGGCALRCALVCDACLLPVCWQLDVHVRQCMHLVRVAYIDPGGTCRPPRTAQVASCVAATHKVQRSYGVPGAHVPVLRVQAPTPR